MYDECVLQIGVHQPLKFGRIKELRDAVGNRHCYKEKRSTDKPAHAHLRRFNIISNYVHIIVIMCAAAGYGVWVSITHMGK